MEPAGDRSCGEATVGRHRVHAVDANGQLIFAHLSSATGIKSPKPNCLRDVSTPDGATITKLLFCPESQFTCCGGAANLISRDTILRVVR